MTSTYSTDIAIFGGGIAGLWLLNRFQAAGYETILLESASLGEAQTLASQGIIHGGLKYALSGSLTKSADTIAGMPQRWRQCLAGDDEVDLTGCRILSDDYYMWSDAGIRSKLKTFLAARACREELKPSKPINTPQSSNNLLLRAVSTNFPILSLILARFLRF